LTHFAARHLKTTDRMSPKTKLDWEIEYRRQVRAGDVASDLLNAFGLDQPPIDPLAIVECEGKLLTAIGADLGTDCDGQLEYHPRHGRFLLFFNTKYDTEVGVHHPRTRFSISHELGHFYLLKHHAHLRAGGATHGSRSESWSSDSLMEREADAFAAGLLMPKNLMRPLVNEAELSLDRIEAFAGIFQTSRVSTAIRSVQLCEFRARSSVYVTVESPGASSQTASSMPSVTQTPRAFRSRARPRSGLRHSTRATHHVTSRMRRSMPGLTRSPLISMRCLSPSTTYLFLSWEH
jgi:hypothetical protein